MKQWVTTCRCHSTRGGLWLDKDEEPPKCAMDGGPIFEDSLSENIWYYWYCLRDWLQF
jgi:hypothetical protein